MVLNKQACENIKVLRVEKNLTQQKVADLLQIERTTYSKIESGKTDLTLNMLEKITKIFETNISTLLSLDNMQINTVTNNTGTFSAQGINTTLHLNIPPEFIELLKSTFVQDNKPM